MWPLAATVRLKFSMSKPERPLPFSRTLVSLKTATCTFAVSASVPTVSISRLAPRIRSFASGTLRPALSSTSSLATSRISTLWTLPRTVVSLHLEAATGVFASGILKRISKCSTCPSRMALLLLRSLLIVAMSRPVPWTRASESGTSTRVALSFVLRESKATRTAFTVLLLLLLEIVWSVEVWTRPSRCGS